MTPFQEFIYEQRLIELEVPYLIINENISPKLYEYLTTLTEIKLIDGEYHKYCGEVRALINNFINYWSEIINECVKEADTLRHCTNRKNIVDLIDKTTAVQKCKHEKFMKSFKPVETPEQKSALANIEKKYACILVGMAEMRETVKQFDKDETVLEFVTYHTEFSIKKKNEAFDFTHTVVSRRLAEVIYRIRVSFEDILLRLRNNLKRMREERDEVLHRMLDEMYEVNKERLIVSRQESHRTTDTAEAEWAIKKIREEIEIHQMDTPLKYLEDEVHYWEKRLVEFKKIEKSIKILKKELDDVTNYKKRYDSMKTTELPGSKKKCWENMGENFTRRLEYVDKLYIEAAKAVMTFFAVRGQNRIFYQDNIGKYNMDDYGHQIYNFDFGKKMCHLNCAGEYREVSDTDKYYYDRTGRYVIGEKGEKIYQCAPCTSSYNLGEDGLLYKITKDCGHSEKPNPECRLFLKDPNIVELLPATEPVDIKKTLTTDVVRYLWDSFGALLPDALCQVGEKRSRNLIYDLGQALLKLKYIDNTVTQLEEKGKAADLYRANIFQQRKERAVIANKTWREKQVKPRKPEEFDDAENRAAYSQLVANQQLTNQITFYDYY